MFCDCGKENNEDNKVELIFDKLNHQDIVIQKASAKTLYCCDGNMDFVDVSKLFAFDVQALKLLCIQSVELKVLIQLLVLQKKETHQAVVYFNPMGIFLQTSIRAQNIVHYRMKRSANWEKLATEKLVLLLRATESMRI